MLSGPLGVRVCLQAAADLDASWHDLSKFVKVRPAQICQAATCEIWHRMVPCAHQSTEHAYLPFEYPCKIYSHCRLKSSCCACAAAEPVLRERGVCPQRRRQQICDPQPAHEGTRLSTVEAALRDHLTSSLRSRLRLRITCLQLLQLPAPLPQPPGRAASITELPPWYSPLTS